MIGEGLKFNMRRSNGGRKRNFDSLRKLMGIPNFSIGWLMLDVSKIK